MQNKLTGIERELVLRYLQDANVPVTVTPLESVADSFVHSAASAVFPVALQPEKMTVLNQGIILLKNPPQSAADFAGKMVRVEFYFNRLGLCFTTKMTQVSSGLALVIPSEINKISETPIKKTNSFKADIYYKTKNDNEVHIICIAAEGYQLFSKPVWKDISLEESGEAKKYLEQFVAETKKQNNIGNGIYLIPVCRFLTEKKIGFQSIQGRSENPEILYVNHECMVLGSSSAEFPLNIGTEYSVKLYFPLEIKPLSVRTVDATFLVLSTYEDDTGIKKSAVCRFTDMKEEDMRFVYEMTTKNLFI